MAHLFSGMINTNNNWEKLSKFTQFNLVSGQTYKIQILDSANLRKGTIGEGFYYNNAQPFDFVAEDGDVYIKTSGLSCLFSIEGGSTTPVPEPTPEPTEEPTSEPTPTQYTLTINPSPADATVTLTAAGETQVNNSITVDDGTTVSYTVSKTGYITSTGTYTLDGADHTEGVVLEEDVEIWSNPDSLQTVYVKYNQTIGQYGLYSDSPATTPVLTNNGNPMYLVGSNDIYSGVLSDVNGTSKPVYATNNLGMLQWSKNRRQITPLGISINFAEAESTKTLTFQNNGSVTASGGGCYYIVSGYVAGGVVSAMDIDAGSATVSFVPELFPSNLALNTDYSGYTTDLPTSITVNNSASQTIAFTITKRANTVNLDWDTGMYSSLECYTDENAPSFVNPFWDMMLTSPWLTTDYDNIELSSNGNSIYNDGSNIYYPFTKSGTDIMITSPSTGLILCASPSTDEWGNPNFIGSEIYEYNSTTETINGTGTYISGGSMMPAEPLEG